MRAQRRPEPEALLELAYRAGAAHEWIPHVDGAPRQEAPGYRRLGVLADGRIADLVDIVKVGLHRSSEGADQSEVCGPRYLVARTKRYALRRRPVAAIEVTEIGIDHRAAADTVRLPHLMVLEQRRDQRLVRPIARAEVLERVDIRGRIGPLAEAFEIGVGVERVLIEAEEIELSQIGTVRRARGVDARAPGFVEMIGGRRLVMAPNFVVVRNFDAIFGIRPVRLREAARDLHFTLVEPLSVFTAVHEPFVARVDRRDRRVLVLVEHDVVGDAHIAA